MRARVASCPFSRPSGRARARPDLPTRVARANAVLLMLGKIPEALGLAEYHLGRLLGRQAQLIEYKGPAAG